MKRDASRRRRAARRRPLLLAFLAVLAVPAAAQESGSAVPGGLTGSKGFRLGVELKAGTRGSTDVVLPVDVDGLTGPLALETVSPHGSAELADVAVTADGDLSPDIAAHVDVHLLDLYNRNPTTHPDRVFVREAWIRFGRKSENLVELPSSSLYLQLGRAPRFTKQTIRHLESYGLWGTAIGRFEETGLEVGGSVGPVYARVTAGAGNPVFLRDPNALAGDSGVSTDSLHVPPGTPFRSGIPILYDTLSPDLTASGRFQVGAGLGVRFNWGETRRDGVDVLGWYFERSLADRAVVRGAALPGDLALFRGLPGGIELPTSGRTKAEWGVTAEARLGALHLYGTAVRQGIAGLFRDGYEAEATYRVWLDGLFVSGDSPVVNWIAPVVRVSRLLDHFAVPDGFVAPSLDWTWTKIDVGVRVGIVRGIDVTLEFSRDSVTNDTGIHHPDELLSTLRVQL